jgi:hypothetical protein
LRPPGACEEQQKGGHIHERLEASWRKFFYCFEETDLNLLPLTNITYGETLQTGKILINFLFFVIPEYGRIQAISVEEAAFAGSSRWKDSNVKKYSRRMPSFKLYLGNNHRDFTSRNRRF